MGDDEWKPASVLQQPVGVTLCPAVRSRVEVGRDIDVGRKLNPARRRAGQHDGLPEHLRIAQPELIRGVATH